MKKLAVLFIFLLCNSCASKASPLKAVYLTHAGGELSEEDLRAHPQVIVVQSFDELKKQANQKIALWIDKSATPFDSEQEDWINAAPQAYYPLALIGTSDTLYAFRDLLRLRGLQGPASRYPGYDASGFSVIQREPPADPNTAPINVPLMHGYDQKPTVQSILEITNDLLEGKIRATPISTLPPPAKEIATPAIHQVILYDDEPKNGFPNDAAKINSVALGGNILTIDVAYQGNCKEHTFELYAWTAFLESNPQQGVLFLSHDAHGDTCTENVEQELSFDLTPLDESRTGRHANPLLLRITEPIGGSFATKPFMPLIEWP
jgi:putative nigrescin immunity protein NigD